MYISQRRLMGLPVRTRSGTALGKLTDLVVDTDTGRLAAFMVRTRGFIPGLMDHELRIAWTQVISLSEKELVVTDGSVPSGATRFIAGLTGKKLSAMPPIPNASTET
ncbi:PRC-barrel domain-containing protein [Candidatus Uhrbacteria bacterium]|nr:PRC-barrel domain-containing protein [Candidatus Uhrbacteria bacterium]